MFHINCQDVKKLPSTRSSFSAFLSFSSETTLSSQMPFSLPPRMLGMKENQEEVDVYYRKITGSPKKTFFYYNELKLFSDGFQIYVYLTLRTSLRPF